MHADCLNVYKYGYEPCEAIEHVQLNKHEFIVMENRELLTIIIRLIVMLITSGK